MKTETKFDPVQTWTDTVGYSHSNCKKTATQYTTYFKRFCTFIGKSATEILTDYEESTDRDFKRKYAQFVRGWIGSLTREGYASKTVVLYAAAVQSFFKYNDLPLGHIPRGAAFIMFHNRDITKQEIVDILSISKPREKAFFAVMAQSGLRPQTICQLKLKHLQPDLKEKRIPCLITVPQELAKGKYRAYFTFIGEEAITCLVNYLKTRTTLNAESYLFTQRESENPIDYSNVSHRFRDAVLKLRKKGILSFEQKERGKPSEIRLYSLRKYFRKYANQAGFEFVQFWMGHIVKQGQEESYRPLDVEFHRKLYAEKAMPFLRIEKPSRSEMGEIIEEKAKEIEDLQRQLTKANAKIERVEKYMSFAKKEIEKQQKEAKEKTVLTDVDLETVKKIYRELKRTGQI
jgi:integrase